MSEQRPLPLSDGEANPLLSFFDILPSGIDDTRPLPAAAEPEVSTSLAVCLLSHILSDLIQCMQGSSTRPASQLDISTFLSSLDAVEFLSGCDGPERPLESAEVHTAPVVRGYLIIISPLSNLRFIGVDCSTV